MTEQTKPQQTRTKLAFRWIDEEGFVVTPIQVSTTEAEAAKDTAFLLKSSTLPRPVQVPPS